MRCDGSGAGRPMARCVQIVVEESAKCGLALLRSCVLRMKTGVQAYQIVQPEPARRVLDQQVLVGQVLQEALSRGTPSDRSDATRVLHLCYAFAPNWHKLREEEHS